MFYKKIDEVWHYGLSISLPTEPMTVLDENNRENDHGWEWHDTPPKIYLEWKEEQDILLNEITEGNV